jgi:hypothetical protein
MLEASILATNARIAREAREEEQQTEASGTGPNPLATDTLNTTSGTSGK